MLPFTSLLNQIADGQDLSEEQAETAVRAMMSGDVSPALAGAFLWGLKTKGEAVSEIAGAARAMRGLMTGVAAPEGAIDVCGTGGDKSGTYNISTAVSFVLAGSGVPVAKHGNRAATSKSGAADVLEKPVSVDALELLLERVRQRTRLLRENALLREESVGGDMVVASPQMRGVVDVVARVARSSATVLVQGESGTGKECIAALLHKRSERAERAFVKLNCAAVPEALLESELFGHEAGAFTGAGRRREGRFELADGGTLFLDEVGEMSPAMQAKLLRVLQEGEFERVGGSETVKVDVRVVAATNRDLEQEVEAGRFRGDLLYRLNVVPVTLPPLRDRREDIVPLARHFLRDGLRFTAEAEAALSEWSWPGNVRELQNMVQRVELMVDGDEIDRVAVQRWLDPEACAAEEPTVVLPAVDPLTALVGRPLAEVEHELIQRTLRRCNGNRKRTAETLGIGVRTLFNKLKAGEAPALAEV